MKNLAQMSFHTYASVSVYKFCNVRFLARRLCAFVIFTDITKFPSLRVRLIHTPSSNGWESCFPSASPTEYYQTLDFCQKNKWKMVSQSRENLHLPNHKQDGTCFHISMCLRAIYSFLFPLWSPSLSIILLGCWSFPSWFLGVGFFF